jgi:hypothetical protein
LKFLDIVTGKFIGHWFSSHPTHCTPPPKIHKREWRQLWELLILVHAFTNAETGEEIRLHELIAMLCAITKERSTVNEVHCFVLLYFCQTFCMDSYAS